MEILINVKTISGRKLTLSFELTQKISDIKEFLAEKEGIPVSQTILTYFGKILKDDSTIEEAKIVRGSTLYQKIPLKGEF